MGRTWIAGLAVAAPLVACHGAPARPPASGPVGASGTCWVQVRGAPLSPGADAGDASTLDPNIDSTAPELGFIVEDGALRELRVTVPAILGPDDVRIEPQECAFTHSCWQAPAWMSAHASGLQVPLVVGEWTAQAVTLHQVGGDADPNRKLDASVRLRVLGDAAEAEFGYGVARGDCVWGRVDRDSLK